MNANKRYKNIVFSGAQGVGKTTLIDSLYKISELAPYRNYVWTYFPSASSMIGKTCPINELGTDDSQRQISYLQFQQLSQCKNISNKSTTFFIFDRGLLDSFTYSVWLKNNGKISKETFNYCKDLFENNIKKYDIIFFLEPEFEIIERKLRSTNKEFQAEINDIFKENIAKWKLNNVVKLSGSVSERMKQIEYNFRIKLQQNF